MSLLHLKVKLERSTWRLNGLLMPNEIEVPLVEFGAEKKVNVVDMIAKLLLVTMYTGSKKWHLLQMTPKRLYYNYFILSCKLTEYPLSYSPKKRTFLHFSVGEHDNSKQFEQLIFIEITLFFIEIFRWKKKNSKAKTSYILQKTTTCCKKNRGEHDNGQEKF